MGRNEIENKYGDRARNEGGKKKDLNLKRSNCFWRQYWTSKVTKTVLKSEAAWVVISWSSFIGICFTPSLLL